MGRYRTPKDGTVVLTGQFNGKKQMFEYRGAATKERNQLDFVPPLGHSQGGLPLEKIRLHGEKPELKEEIAALGKRYGIVTPYTSYLVVEYTRVVANRPQQPVREDPSRFRADDVKRTRISKWREGETAFPQGLGTSFKLTHLSPTYVDSHF